MRQLFFIVSLFIGLSSQAYPLDPINCSGINSRNSTQYKLIAQPYTTATLIELTNRPPYKQWDFTYYSRQSVTTIYSNRYSIGTYVKIIGVNGTYSVDFYLNNQIQFTILCR